MKVFIDSSQNEFAVAVFDNNFNVIKARIFETKFKVESIIDFFNELESIESLNSIYINRGPGSFTGIRSALIYVRTLAQLNSNIKIFTSTTFDILKRQQKGVIFSKNIFYINATKTKSFCMAKQEIQLVEKQSDKEITIDYEQLISNFPKYINIFSPTSLDQLDPNYVSNPQIGNN